MDDTVAMQDTSNRVVDACALSMNAVSADPAAGGGSSTTASGDSSLLAQKLAAVGAAASSQPSTPQQQLQQQGAAAGDACSVTSEGSQEGGRQAAGLRLGPGGGDVDAAKQAAMSALAGLGLTTTKANLDASKAAAATARANGEVPTHQRKSNLRSVSCRQLGSSSSSAAAAGVPLAGKSVAFDTKTVAFDDAAKRAAADGRPAPGQWRGPSTLVDRQQRRINRAPASRCISLPHIMQGRQGMANRLAASYAQDAALQQQLQMLNGSSGMAQPYAAMSQQLHQVGLGRPADTLTLYQLQHQGISAPAPQTLLTQRSFAGAPGLAVDGSGLIVQPQLQPLQPQQAHLTAGGWVPAAAAGGQPGGLTRWGSGQMQLQQAGGGGLTQAQAVTANAQLLAQLQVSSQAQQGGDGLWMAAPASGGLQMAGSHAQGVMMQPQAAAVSAGMNMGGIPGLQSQQQLMASQLQAAAGAAGGMVAPAAGQAAVGGPLNGHSLLEQYQSVSWSVLAAAQGEAALRDQLLTELVLLLTMLHTLSNTLKGSMAPGDALSDFSYLAAAARRHMATFARLSQAGNIAVQLLALVTPLALKHLNSAELLEAAFLVLDTLALANRDVAATVTTQRLTAAASLGLALPVDQLLQQQTLGLHWITNLANAVSRNKAVLESMAADGGAAAGGAVVGSAGLVQGGGMSAGGMLAGGLGMAAVSQPMMMAGHAGATAAVNTTISPTRKTPLATYFEEAPGAAVAAGLGAVGAGLAPGAAAVANGVRLGAGTPPGTRIGDPLMGEALPGMHLAGPAAAAAPGSGLMSDAAPGHLALGELEKMTAAGLSLGAGPVQAGPGSHGTYSPLGGGLSLFGDSTLLGMGAPGSSGPSSTGASSLVGV